MNKFLHLQEFQETDLLELRVDIALSSCLNNKSNIQEMDIFIILSLPGLVVAIIMAGVIQLARAKKSGKRRPGAATFGLNILDTTLRPGSEHKLIEQDKKRMQAKKTGNEDKLR